MLPSMPSEAWVVRLAVLGVEARRPVGHRIAVHDHRPGVLSRRIHDPRHDPAGDGRAVRVFGDRHDDVVIVRPRSGGARSVALPAAGEADVAIGAFDRHDGEPAGTVRYVVPHQVARFRHVHRLHDLERGGIFHHAARVTRCQLDVLNDGVAAVLGIEFAKRLAGERLVLAGIAEAGAVESRRGFLLDDDAGNPRLRGGGHRHNEPDRRQAGRGLRDGHAKLRCVADHPFLPSSFFGVAFGAGHAIRIIAV